MLRNFKDITPKDLEYLRSHRVMVEEKLDLPYFKIYVFEDKLVILNKRGVVVDDILCTINSFWENVREFVYTNIEPIREKLFAEFGRCTIGMFYCPVEKPNYIKYPKLVGEFIFSDIYTENKQANDYYKIRNFDVIKDLRSTVADRIAYLPDTISPDDAPEDICYKLLSKCGTVSDNYISNIEGIVLASGPVVYQVSNKVPGITDDKATRKLYRDAFVTDFACSMSMEDIDNIISVSENYLDCIWRMFLDYVEKTNIFSRIFIEKEDLLPPMVGEIGPVCFKYLPKTAEMVCKSNPLYENILRLFLATFNRTKRFTGLNESICQKLDQIKAKISVLK